MKRRPKVRALGDDFHWFWAAYRHGEGDFAPSLFGKGLDQEEFRKKLLAALERLDDHFIMEAEVKDQGRIPVGLATLKIIDRHLQPHFDWFWWASKRNKLEAGLKFFAKFGDEPMVIAVPAETPVDDYCDHLSEYGVLRHIGISYNWADKKAVLYETRS